jgi:leader peptidase (prepilin peptidase)/N-methyltransferase
MMLVVVLVPLLAWLFLLGSAVGSFLNVCIARLPGHKSLIWPGSRCGRCFRPVRLEHNIPLVSYWWLRGRCKDCGARFSMRYFWVELATGLAFVGLYVLEVGLNVHGLAWEGNGFTYLEWGRFAPHSWALFFPHAVLASLLIAATGALLEHGRVPPGVTATGLVVGVVAATLSPGLYPSPIEIAGALGAAWLLRAAAWLAAKALGREAFSAAGADLLLIAGSFLGWQPAVVALGLAAILAGLTGIPLLLARRVPLPFGLWLAAGIVVAWLGWAWLGPLVRPVLFNPLLFPALLAASLALVGAVALLVRRLTRQGR